MLLLNLTTFLIKKVNQVNHYLSCQASISASLSVILDCVLVIRFDFRTGDLLF